MIQNRFREVGRSAIVQEEEALPQSPILFQLATEYIR